MLILYSIYYIFLYVMYSADATKVHISMNAE